MLIYFCEIHITIIILLKNFSKNWKIYFESKTFTKINIFCIHMITKIISENYTKSPIVSSPPKTFVFEISNDNPHVLRVTVQHKNLNLDMQTSMLYVQNCVYYYLN